MGEWRELSEWNPSRNFFLHSRWGIAQFVLRCSLAPHSRRAGGISKEAAGQ